MLLGVISDTHGLLPTSLPEVFAGVDYIIHCGGIGGAEVVDRLSTFGRVTGVVTDSDDAALFPFGRTLLRRWLGIPVLALGGALDPRELSVAARTEIERSRARVILSGGGRAPCCAEMDGRLYFCPGIARPGRRGSRPTVGLVEITAKKVRAEVIALG